MNLRIRDLRSSGKAVKTVVVLGCLLAITALQGRSESDPSAALSGIAHVAIRVSNLDRSREFYHRLGYDEAFAMEKGGTPTQAFFKVNDRQYIELYPQRQPDQTIGFMHVCFEASHLEQLHDFYAGRGLAPTMVRKAGAGNLLFTMQGPEKQNIEYTQYMPGSRHTLDIGKHLGTNRIADGMVGVAIEMQDIPAAEEYYQSKLSFSKAEHSAELALPAYVLPGGSGEQIAFVPKNSASHYHLILGVKSIKTAEEQLKALQIPVERSKGTITLRDPDGNLLVLVAKR